MIYLVYSALLHFCVPFFEETVTLNANPNPDPKGGTKVQ